MKALLPVAGLVVVGVSALGFWLAYSAAHPPTHAYLVRPGQFPFSPRAVKTTEETWSNSDGTTARGWLLRGAEGSPGVVLLHGYGGDRSWLFNLGVKINETTNFTVLCPDLRGHGQSPSVSTTTFGAREADDLASAISFLRSLKSQQQRPLVGPQFGAYGVGLGAYAALTAAPRDGAISALALDSVPADSDQVLRDALRDHVGLGGAFFFHVGRFYEKLYTLAAYRDASACDAAASVGERKVLLLSGPDAADLRESTAQLARCFPATASVETKTDLPLTGLQASSATGEAGEAYDRLVIDFFQRSLH
ncbi:MAG: alpha/beta fold hydrolase [Acidobacteriota bacterium]|nr:alpha/beta fold hydrolase [Acidobacteriota bacterium]